MFLRAKLKDAIYSDLTFLQSYTIKEGMRPDTVAEEMYGSDELDWVVLMTAGIINARDEWPFSDKEIYDYCVNTKIPYIATSKKHKRCLDRVFEAANKIAKGKYKISKSDIIVCVQGDEPMLKL